MANDNLDEAVKLRAIIDRIKTEVEKPELPEDKSRLARAYKAKSLQKSVRDAK